MSFFAYRAGRVAAQYILSQTLRQFVLNLAYPPPPASSARSSGMARLRMRHPSASPPNFSPGGHILACTHISHVEPFIISTVVSRQIRWMARIEFYRFRIFSILLDLIGAFPVHRQGVPVQAVRRAISLANAGEIVGIFPEGGCVRGRQLAVRGGRIRHGVASISLRSQKPIVPVVVLGTDRLTAIEPWLPARRGKIWIAFGAPLLPPPLAPRPLRRRQRCEFAAMLEAAYVQTYQTLLQAAGLSDAMTH